MDKELKERIELIKSKPIPEDVKQHSIGLMKKDDREKKRFLRMSKEEKLKHLYSRYLDLAVDFAKMLPLKKTTETLTKELKTRLKFELTMALKEANVLPLEG
jgi:hypothetical protein